MTKLVLKQDDYNYLRDLCEQAVQDGDVMIIARMLKLDEDDARARLILTIHEAGCEVIED